MMAQLLVLSTGFYMEVNTGIIFRFCWLTSISYIHCKIQIMCNSFCIKVKFLHSRKVFSAVWLLRGKVVSFMRFLSRRFMKWNATIIVAFRLFFQVHTKIVPNADFTTFRQNYEAIAFEPWNSTTVVGASEMYKNIAFYPIFWRYIRIST